MIPFQYFLILILLLMSMTGCVQRPPHSVGLTTVSNSVSNPASGKTNTDTNRQKILRDPSPTIKPALNPFVQNPPVDSSASPVHLSVMNEGFWTLILSGEDATRLDQLLEVVPYRTNQDESGILNKIGKSYYCAHFQETICVFNLGMEDGALFEVPDAQLDQSDRAETVIHESYLSENLELDPIEKGKFGRLLLKNEEAQKIYESLTVSEVTLMDEGNETLRTEKKGKHIGCIRYGSPEKTGFQYRCRSYFNYDTGRFDEIQVSR
jgi:hypothetical protein